MSDDLILRICASDSPRPDGACGRGSDHCHRNDDKDSRNRRRKGNATEYRVSDRPVFRHRTELDRRQRRLGRIAGFIEGLLPESFDA